MVTLLLASPASADVSICTLASANDTLDTLKRGHGEVPILKMKVAGNTQAFLVANPQGEFVLLVLQPDGRACVLAIGEELKTASPTDRFAKELVQ